MNPVEQDTEVTAPGELQAPAAVEPAGEFGAEAGAGPVGDASDLPSDLAGVETASAVESAAPPEPAEPLEPAVAAEVPPAPRPPRSATRKRKGITPDGAGGTAFGLIVIWICLTLVFYAHSQSDTFIHLLPAADLPPKPNLLTPQVALQRPISLFQRDTTRQILTSLAGLFGFTISPAELEKLGDAGDEIRSINLKNVPVYSALHQVMDDPQYDHGIALRGHELQIFSQKLETRSAGNNVQEMTWNAELELDSEPLMIFPSADTDLWFKVRVAGGAGDQPEKTALEIEVWRGPEWLSMARVELDASGAAQLTMSNVENSQFIVHRLAAPEGAAATHYNLQFLKQSFTQAKPVS